MTTEEKLDLLLRTGAAFLGSGANSNRVENAIMTAGKITGLPRERIHLHMNLRTLMLSVEEDGRSVTKFQKVLHLAVDLRRIDGLQGTLNSLCTERESGMSVEDAEKALNAAIERPPPKTAAGAVIIGVGVACAGFCCFLGGNRIEWLFALIGASVGLMLRRRLIARGVAPYFTTMICACLSAWLAAPPLRLDTDPTKNTLAIAASVLYLIPGVPMINSIDDLIDGFTIMGTGRAMIAILHILSIGIGLGVAVGVLHLFGINVNVI